MNKPVDEHPCPRCGARARCAAPWLCEKAGTRGVPVLCERCAFKLVEEPHR